MIESQEKAPETNLQGVKCLIGIAAGKGGVGKSTITVNMALALHKKGYKVGILDADIYGPSIRKMLPEQSAPSQKDNLIVPAIASGMKIVSMAYFRSEPMAVRAPIANGVIQQFLTQVDWGELDYLLIDFPPGTGDVQLTLLQQAALHGAILVTTPQEVAVLDVRKAMQLFIQMEVPMLGIVENMSYFEDPITKVRHFPFGKGGGKGLSEEFGIPFLGEIPLDHMLSSCGDKGDSIFVKDPDGVSANIFEKMEAAIQEQLGLLHTSECLKSFELIWKL